MFSQEVVCSGVREIKLRSQCEFFCLSKAYIIMCGVSCDVKMKTFIFYKKHSLISVLMFSLEMAYLVCRQQRIT